MAKYKAEYENGIAKYTLYFRERDFDYSMIPTENGIIGDKCCFSTQLADVFPDLNEDELYDIGVDMLGCTLDDDEIFEVLEELGALE